MQCVTACQRGAIRHDDRPTRLELDVGAIIVATGFDVFDPHLKPEFGYGVYPQVMTTLEFERMVSASGPTAGKILLDGQSPAEGGVHPMCRFPRPKSGAAELLAGVLHGSCQASPPGA